MDKSLDPNYILNPKSGRYVLKSGKIGKLVSQQLLKEETLVYNGNIESLSNLPDHVIISVLKNTDIESLYNLCRSDKKINKLCKQNRETKKRINDYLEIVNLGKLTKKKKNELLTEYAKKGNLDIVKFLLDKGANIHYFNDDALRYAVWENRLETVKFLLDNGADISIFDNGTSIRASKPGYLDMMKFLLEHNIKIIGIEVEETDDINAISLAVEKINEEYRNRFR